MSAKWRALQHRHQYTYTAVIFPQSYIEKLNSLPVDFVSLSFFSELKELIYLNSIYTQVNAVKKVASAFGELLGNNGEAVVSEASRFYLEILFMENSLPLHRTLVSVLTKSRNFHSVIASCFLSLCDEYGVVSAKERRFLLSRVALSMMSCPKLGFLVDVVEKCSISMALDAAYGLKAVAMEVSNGSRPSPVAMEQCQEALSCLYYLLQRFPFRFTNSTDFQANVVPEDSTISEIVMDAIISILKSSSFSRDSLVAAGVAFCAALQLCLTPEELQYFIVRSFFCNASIDVVNCINSKTGDMELKVPFKGDLYLELGKISVLSRLCLLRGILTAIPRTVLSTHIDLSGDGINCLGVDGFLSSTVWTILFDGILPELCNYCENPVDSHFNFHVLTVMQICFQQIKTLVSGNFVTLSESYNPLPEEMGSRVLRIIWDNLEDPLNQTVKQVHLIFDLFLDIQSTLTLPGGSERTKSFLHKTTSDLLRLGPRCKGRYVPLASLTKRLGAKTVLKMNGDLLFETIYAYIDDDVCCAATTFLKCFLECLRDECWSTDGVERGSMIFRGHFLSPIMYGLVSGVSKLRSNLNTYALSVVLEVDVDSIFPMLEFISVGQNTEDIEVNCLELAGAQMALSVDQRVAALVSLLKVSRSLALIEGDIEYDEFSVLQEIDLSTENSNLFARLCMKGVNVKVPVKWLVLALTHVDETLRVDAAESLFLNPKTSSLPSHLELSLLKEAVPLNMRCCSTAFQMKWTSMFRKLFSRVRTALEREFKQGSRKPMICSESSEVVLNKNPKEILADRAKDLFQFMRWFSCFLFFSCYPSAPYERKIMAMELILIMINIWSVIQPTQSNCTSNPASCIRPYNEGLTLPDSALLLVGSIVDSWDRLRENSFRILLHFPTPLPGISSEDKVKEVITWAKQLVCSPRVRESDAGALTLRLIFRKYVLELGWIVGASVNVVCFHSQSELLNGAAEVPRSRFPVIEYILSLIDWLHASVAEGEKDLSEACKISFVHGVLLTLRYTFEELDWNSDVVFSSSSEMRDALEKLLELVKRITSLALWVVSADAWHLPEDMDEDDAFISDLPVEMAVPESSSKPQAINSIPMDATVKASEQVVMVGCWLAMKEVSLLLGTITRKIPLPTCSTMDSTRNGGYLSEGCGSCPMTVSDEILDLKQLESIGNHFLEVLLKMKHNGAIDKTRAGFTALCNRLLCSNDPSLCKMTDSWMEQLMQRTVAKGQTVDDLLRRSAGIPAGFIALFLSEPGGTPKKLLPRALRWLIDVANMSLPSPVEAKYQNDGSGENLGMKSNHTPICTDPTEQERSEKASKERHEGVIPTVHAFNVLRAAFNDTNLATDVSGFCAEALIISIRSFASPYWEVRNSACLAYTALFRRMIGFLNVQKRESARRALTSVEFFHRYPTLHPFLFHELKIATELLGDGSSSPLEANISKVVHPSLCPVLILLSRLKPSMISCDTEDPLDPFLFMPFIRKCSTQSNLRVRVLASRALLGLVSNEKLPIVLLNIANGLPHTSTETTNHPSPCPSERSTKKYTSFNSIHGMLLQLCSLLDHNCRNLADVSKKDQILGDLIQVLKTCLWICSPKLCPCSVLNISFLQLLNHILDIVRTSKISRHIEVIRSILLELSTECLEEDVSPDSVFQDPAKAELHRQASVSYFNCVFQNNKSAEEGYQMLFSHSPLVFSSFKVSGAEKEVAGLLKRLILSMSDLLYDVRLVTLKWLLRFLESTVVDVNYSQSSSDIDSIHLSSDIDSIHHWAETNLQPMLIQLLGKENHPKCTCYILRILFIWNLQLFQRPKSQLSADTVYVGGMDCDSVLEFWDQLMSLKKVVRHAKIREALLCCMGVCVKRFANLLKNSILLDIRGKNIVNISELERSERWSHIYGCICSFVNIIKQHSASSEPVNMRKAAADSMIASGLLGEAGHIYSFVSNSQIPSDDKYSFRPSEAANLYACRILDLWFTCITLLEDEDVRLRESLAQDVQRCFTVNGSSEKRRHLGAAQVEKVIEMSFEFLSSVFGHWLMYFDYLASCVLNTAAYIVAKGDLIRRVFDKEIDNHHEEKLLICQICCLHLEKLALSMTWGVGLPSCKVVAYLQRWRLRFYDQLISFANDYLRAEIGINWIGGPGNHKDVFISLYANMLGLHALSRCHFDRKSEICMPQLSDLVDLERVIRPFLRNPLICNLYLLIVQAHERHCGVAIDPLGPKTSKDSYIWEVIQLVHLAMARHHGVSLLFPLLVITMSVMNTNVNAARHLFEVAEIPKPTLPSIPTLPTLPKPELPTLPKVELPPLPQIPTLPKPELPLLPKNELPPLPHVPTFPKLDEVPTLPKPELSPLPQIPTLPKIEVPKLPEVPTLPKVEVPKLSEVPTLPKVEVPKLPEVPTLPKVEVPKLPEVPTLPKPELPSLPKNEVPKLPEVPALPKPELPSLPKNEVPKLPEVPALPKPELPKIEVPKLPELPEVPKPTLPTIPTLPKDLPIPSLSPPHSTPSP
ncbi:Thyroid adenoma-associated protein-like protein [Thalictrum thalictroides]|uniref:Thyroid adenoma-associated protein-like protein n=1 Tax=Thalictrum thalictroides TaxID=46969 RepID=A0A7J6WII5_THATH|nr:Thyroid adenoma-associated protein-like protein [Thalictrum thalictroides]